MRTVWDVVLVQVAEKQADPAPTVWELCHVSPLFMSLLQASVSRVIYQWKQWKYFLCLFASYIKIQGVGCHCIFRKCQSFQRWGLHITTPPRCPHASQEKLSSNNPLCVHRSRMMHQRRSAVSLHCAEHLILSLFRSSRICRKPANADWREYSAGEKLLIVMLSDLSTEVQTKRMPEEK